MLKPIRTLALTLLVAPFVSQAASSEPIVIDRPTIITEPGTYILDNDFSDVEESVFIDIQSSDVTLDGQGHLVSGRSETGTIGVRASGSDAPIGNVTIQNLHVESWGTGIHLEDVEEGALSDNEASGCDWSGFVVKNVSGVVANNLASENSIGFVLEELEDTTVKQNSALANAWEGFRYRASGFREKLGNAFEHNIANDNGISGFSILTRYALTITGNEANGNGSYGFDITAEEVDIVLRENAASGNGYNLKIEPRITGRSLAHLDIDQSNLVEGAPVVFLTNTEGPVSFPHEIGYLAIINSNDIQLDGVDLLSPNGTGLLIADSQDCTLSNINIQNAEYGLQLQRSENISLQNMQLAGNEYNLDISGNAPEHFAHDIDTSNLVDGSPVLYLRDAEDLVIDETTEAGYIGIVGSSEISVSGLPQSGNAQGLLIANSTGISATGLTFTATRQGVVIADSTDISLEDLAIADTPEGIRIARSEDVSLTGITSTPVDLYDLYRFFGILVEESADITGERITIYDHSVAIDIQNSQNCAFHDIELTAHEGGVGIFDSENIAITDGTIVGTTSEIFWSNPSAISVRNSSLISVENMELLNSEFGILLENTSQARLVGNSIPGGTGVAGIAILDRRSVDIYGPAAHLIRDNYVTGLQAVRLWGEGFTGSVIYNNYFEGDRLINDIGQNQWSVEPQPGPNIVGGPVIGGNYWAMPDESGPGQSCPPNTEGFCDDPVTIAPGNVDHLPLADFEPERIAGPTVIDEPGYYVINEDLTVEGDVEFIRIQATDVILDGWNHHLTATGEGAAIVIEDNVESPLTDVTIRNFHLDSWSDAMRLTNVENLEIENNRVEGSKTGVYLASSTGNVFRGNTIRENEVGILLDAASSDNHFHENLLRENGIGIVINEDAAANLFFDNRFIEHEPATGNTAANTWHVDPEEGPNIAGGPLRGGNFWKTPGALPPSQTCPQIADGFCTLPYELPGGGLDPHPIVDAVELDRPAVIDLPGYYYLADEIREWRFEASSSFDNTLFTIDSSNVILDGRGYTVDGHRWSSPSWNILVASGANETPLRNLTVKNFIFDDYPRFELEHVENVRLTNLEASGRGEWNILSLRHATGFALTDSRFTPEFSAVHVQIEDSSDIGFLRNEFIVTGSHEGTLDFQEIEDARIAENLFERTSLSLTSSAKVEIAGNSFENRSINLNNSENVEFSENTLADVAVYLEKLTHTSVVENNVTASTSRIVHCADNLIRGNRFSNSSFNLEGSETAGNLIYDNFFGRPAFIGFNVERQHNDWNIDPVPGRNIVGGPYIAGNFWGNPFGTGHSDTCESTATGLCDSPYPINEEYDQFDHYPLALPLEGSYSDWLSQHFDDEESNDPAIADPTADPGNFGIPNLLRYALDLHPHAPDRTLLPVAGTITSTDNGQPEPHLALTFTRRLDANDIDLRIETSTDLLSWEPLPSVEIEAQAIDGATEHVTIRDSRPLDDKSRYLRVNVGKVEE